MRALAPTRCGELSGRLFEVYGLQVVIDVLGHSPGGVTFRHYVRSRRVDPSLRHALDEFFEEPGSA